MSDNITTSGSDNALKAAIERLSEAARDTDDSEVPPRMKCDIRLVLDALEEAQYFKRDKLFQCLDDARDDERRKVVEEFHRQGKSIPYITAEGQMFWRATDALDLLRRICWMGGDDE